MTIHVGAAHEALKDFCNHDAGIGIAKDMFLRVLHSHVAQSRNHLKNLPSNHNFRQAEKGLQISFDASLDTKQLSLDLLPSDEAYPLLRVSNVRCNLIVKLEGYALCEIGINFNILDAKLILVDRRLTLKLIDHESVEKEFSKLWESDNKLKATFAEQYNFSDATWTRLTHHFRAMSLISTYEIGATFFEAIVFPDLLRIFKGIVFDDDGRLQVNEKYGLVMFSATSSLNFGQCAVDPVDGTIYLQSPVLEHNADDDERSQEWVRIREDSPAKSYPSDNTDRNRNEMNEFRPKEGQVFLHTPRRLLDISFEGVVKPAVKVSNSDSWGPFYYRWEITPSLDGLRLWLMNKDWPITFMLQAPLEVSGQASAGIKIGSVRHEVIGAKFNGRVEPFDIEFRIMLDWSRREIVFESKISDIRSQDFEFDVNPLKFPMSQIVDVILSSVASSLVERQAGKILNATRIPIANLQLLERFGHLKRGISGHKDHEDDTTIGICYE